MTLDFAESKNKYSTIPPGMVLLFLDGYSRTFVMPAG